MNGLPRHVKNQLSSYFRGFNLDGIEIRAGIPRLVRMFAAVEPRAYASKNVLYFSDGVFDPLSDRGIALIGHEVAHSRQYAETGTWRYRLRYLGHYLRNRLKGMCAAEAYESIPFEEEARRIQDLIRKDLLAVSAGRLRSDTPA